MLSTGKLDVDSLIEKAFQLHSPPEVAQSLLALTRDDDYDMREIVDCIQHDPAMSLKILQVVNSSRYGLRTPVTNLHQAVGLLGQRTIRLLAMTFNIVETFATGPAKSLYKDFWRDSLTMANAATRIGQRMKSLDRNDVYTTGLLADVGSLVIAQADGERYLGLYREHRGSSLAHAEQAIYGFDHAIVGARLLEKWHFPKSTLSAVRNHHDENAIEPIILVTHGGARLAEAIWQKAPAIVNACRIWLDKTFKIDIDGFVDLATQCRDEVILELEVYGFNVDQIFDVQAMVEQARRHYLEASINMAMELDSFELVVDGAWSSKASH